MTTIYLVQHGDKERLPGDPGLTELGNRQAASTARWLRERGLRAVYSSPLRRARETAEPVGYATGLAVQVDSRLRERLNWDGSQAFDVFLLGDNGLPARLIADGIPPCAITTLDDLHVTGVAATAHLSGL